MYYLYILQCKDKSLYTGIALDVEKRLKEHKTGKGARYTRAHEPARIVHTEMFPTRSAALKREAEIKKWPREKKLRLFSARYITRPPR
jgi:putative endonuclease